MVMLMRFGLLGPVVMRRGGVLVPVRAPMPRSVLGALLLNANRVVAVERLIDVLWGDNPPTSAVASLHNHITRLRACFTEKDTGRIRSVAPGYLLEVAAGDLDLEVFTRLSRQASRARSAGDWEAAATDLTAALALWRGEALADVTSPVLRATEVPRLSQLRLDTAEARIDACLQLGRYPEVIAELGGLTAANPLRERFHAQLMLGCFLAGRRAEALAAYRRARQVMVRELGVEPGVELQQLHQRILAADPALGANPAFAVDQPPVTTRSPAATVPAQLPPDTTDFTGRGAQVKLLHDLLGARPDGTRPGAVVICVVAGMAGIGKTTLAVHAAHQLGDRFPDGQLFASLQGTSSPLRPADVLARFLRDLGVPDNGIPSGEAERTARYRTLLAARRLLIVLDDARDAAQVRPLLPGTAGCAVIVTSRNPLPGLPGAALVSLEVFDTGEARALFNVIAGSARTVAEPEATAAVLASCAGLPLAVRIAASRLASRSGWNVADLNGKLADERNRLAQLTVGDLAVRASFAVSYDALDPGSPDPARVFRLLGLAEQAALSLPAIAALAGQPVGETSDALEILTDAHLVESPAAGRFRLHDLLRIYAAELAGSTDSRQERNAAIGRMLRWYGEQAVVGARALTPGRRFPATSLFQPAALAITTDPAHLLDWHETELAGLVTATRQAADQGMHDIAAQISVAIWSFFQLAAHDEDWIITSQIGVSSARHLGDDAVLSWLLNSLGQVQSQQGNFAESRRCFTEALAIRRSAGDRIGEAAVLNSMALDLSRRGLSAESLDYLRSALAIYTALGERPYAGILLSNMGEILLHLKRHEEALDHLRQALAIRQETGDRHGEGITEGALGDTYLDLGRFEDAVEHYRRALDAHDGTTREHLDRANFLYSLGSALDSLGRSEQACDAWLTAIPILDRLGDPRAAELSDRLTNLDSPSDMGA